MNVLTETADGVRALTAHEAGARIEHLRGELQRIDARKAAIESEIRALHPVAHPEDAYDAVMPQ